MNGSIGHAVSLLVLLHLFGQPVGILSNNTELTIHSGQEFADAVVAWGRARDDRVLILQQPLISLRNATWPDPSSYPNATGIPGQPFSAGQLTIRSANTVNRSVIDAGNRWGLIPYMQRQAQVTLDSVVLINLCLTSFPLSFSPPIGLTSGFSTRLFVTARESQSETVINTTYYGPQWDIAQHEYFTIVERSHFPPIRAATLPVFGDMSDTQTVIKRITPYSVQVASTTHTSLLLKDIEFASTSNPDDPLLQKLHQQGVILDMQYCNGTRLVQGADQDVIDLHSVPMWLVGDAPAFAHGMSHVANMSKCVLPPAIMVIGNVSLPAQDGSNIRLSTQDASSPAQANMSWLVSCMLQLSGAFEDTPGLQPPTVLDLGRRQAVFKLQAGGQLFIQQMTLQGLLQQPNNTAGVQSVFPLAAISAADSALAVQAWSCNTTLVVPLSDYMAMAALAASATEGMPNAAAAAACVNAATAQVVKYLSANITNISAIDVSNASTPSGRLHLQAFQGWGINATFMRVVSDKPLGVGVSFASCTPAAAVDGSSTATGHSSTTLSSEKKAGLAAALAVGVPLLSLAAGIMVLLVRWQRAAKSTACTPSSSASRKGSQTSPGKLEAAGRTGSYSGQEPHSSSGSTSSSSSNEDIGVRGNSTSSQTAAALSTRQDNHTVLTTTAGGFETSAANGTTDGSALSLLVFSQQQDHLQPLAAAAVASGARNAGLPTAAPSMPAPQPGSSTDGADKPDHVPLDVQSLNKASWLHRVLTPSMQRPWHGPSYRPNAFASHPGAVVGVGDVDAHNKAAPADDAEASLCNTSAWRPRSEVRQLAGTFSSEGAADKVTVTGVLGQGSGGTVFIGEWRSLRVALKTVVVPSGYVAMQRAIMEAAIAASVGHRNVVATYHYDFKPIASTQDGSEGELQVKQEPAACLNEPCDVKLFLVQELCAAPLTEALDNYVLHDPQSGAPDLRAILCVLLDITQGLAYLHDSGIIHGDLKPSNVLLKEDVNAPPLQVVAKLADFGVSVYLGSNQTHVSCYGGGSPWYTAPEVVLHRRASRASDMYSLGVIMWQLYTGQAPWGQAKAPGVTHGGATATVPPAKELPTHQYPVFPDFSAAHPPPTLYVQLMQGCLQEDPRLRPTALQVIECLHALFV